MTALQQLIARHAIEVAIKATPIRKESGTIPSGAIIEDDTQPAKVSDQVPGQTEKQKQAAAARAAAKTKKELAEREKAEMFIREYVNQGFNATEAYRKISPRAKRSSAQSRGSKMLSEVMVQRLLSAYLLKLREQYEIDHQFIWRKWLQHAEANPVSYFESVDGHLKLRDLTLLPEEQQKNLRKVKVTRTSVPQKDGPPTVKEVIEIEVVDQAKAVELMARALGMFDKNTGDGTGEHAIADLIRAGAARIKALGDLRAHRIESD